MSSVSQKIAVPRSKERLNRTDLVGRGLELSDRDGLDSLTIRRLAEEFGVTPMAMYWHFAAKDDLLAAIGDRLVQDIDLPDPALGLAEFLTAALTAVVAALRAHSSAVTLVPARILHTERGRDLTESTLRALADAGFGVGQAAEIAHTALLTAVMLVAGEPGQPDGVPADVRAEELRAKRAALLALPADRYPHLVAAADALTECGDPDSYYRTSIETFVLGVTALLRD